MNKELSIKFQSIYKDISLISIFTLFPFKELIQYWEFNDQNSQGLACQTTTKSLYNFNGKVQLCGDSMPQLQPIRVNKLQKIVQLDTRDSQYYALSIQINDQPEEYSSLPEAIQGALHKFQNIFKDPTILPPSRLVGHIILPNTNPVQHKIRDKHNPNNGINHDG